MDDHINRKVSYEFVGGAWSLRRAQHSNLREINGNRYSVAAALVLREKHRSMTVGRQMVSAPNDAIASILSAFDIPRQQSSAILELQNAEPLFALLGAGQVSSVDAF
jgi:hypothetical protein